MITTWKTFFEEMEAGKKWKKEEKALEKKEEDLGMDLDGDGEKGESKAHKDKVLGPKGCKTCKKSPKKAKK